jgi:TRAP-type C4-dicarboxylate transport system permease small subunit
LRFVEAFALRLIRLLLGTALLASVLLICANAFGRYVLAAPIIWAEEILGYTLVWMVYLGAVQVTSDNGHLSMDLALRYLPARWQAIVEFCGHLVFVAVSALIVYQAYFTLAEFTHHSQIASLPMDIVHAVVPVSFALMAAVVMLHSIARLHGASIADETAPK